MHLHKHQHGFSAAAYARGGKIISSATGDGPPGALIRRIAG
jgi:hypothetical protein